MATATETKRELPPPPKGCVVGKSPAGDPIYVRKPNPPGTYFRIKHPVYGHDKIMAKTEEEAVKKFVDAKCPTEGRTKEKLAAFSVNCRVQPVEQPTTA